MNTRKSLITQVLTAASLFAASSVLATSWYVSPSGSDSNAGTSSAPFKSIAKAQSSASSGDTVYLRGGTYSSFTIAASDSNYNYVHKLSKSGITYVAYSGETPIFNFSSISTSLRVCGFYVTGSSIKFQGFQVIGVPVGSQKQSECFRVTGSDNTFTALTIHDNAANGIYFTGSASGNVVQNCDSYNNLGSGNSLGNTDGFGSHAGTCKFLGCRSWNNSDDGFDCLTSTGSVTFSNCWAYNMNGGGDSNGFKVGGYGTGTVPSTIPTHVVWYCLAAKCGANGFYANHQPAKSANWSYNTAYSCGVDFNMLERVSASDSTDIAGTREVLHYNLVYAGTLTANMNLPTANVSNNSWTKSVTVSSADFKSTDASQMINSRSGTSLPTITFMHLVSGSDLAGLGCF
jgi:hypothetical protein